MKKTKEFVLFLIKRYALSGFWVVIPQVLSALSSLVALPFVLKSISSADFGYFQFVLSLQIWLSIFTFGSITNGATRGIAKEQDGTFVFSFLYRLRFILAVSVIIVLGGVASIYTEHKVVGYLILMMAGYFAFGFLPQTSYPGYFIAKKMFGRFAFWQTAVLTIPTIGSALAAWYTGNVIIYSAAYFGLITAISLAGFLSIFVGGGVTESFKKGEIDRSCVPFGKKMIFADISQATSGQASSLLIAFILGPVSLAIFSIANKLWSYFGNFFASSYHLLYADFAKEEFEAISKKVKSKFFQTLLLSFVISAACFAVGYAYIKFFLPEIYHISAGYFLILSLSFPAVIVQGILQTILAANLRHRALSFLMIVPNLIQIAFVVIFGSIYGIYGVVWAVTAGTWISAIILYLLTINRDFLKNTVAKMPLIGNQENEAQP